VTSTILNNSFVKKEHFGIIMLKIRGAMMINLIARAIWHLGFVDSCP
jgi:hypothetical protein